MTDQTLTYCLLALVAAAPFAVWLAAGWAKRKWWDWPTPTQ